MFLLCLYIYIHVYRNISSKINNKFYWPYFHITRSAIFLPRTLVPSVSIDAVLIHYCDVIMGALASQITSFTIVYSTVHSGVDQRKHQSTASLAFFAGNSPVTGEFPAQMASNAENVSIWWRYHVFLSYLRVHCILTYCSLIAPNGVIELGHVEFR